MRIFCAVGIILAFLADAAGLQAASAPAAPTAPTQPLSRGALVAALRKGGNVIVIRHASSPAALPDKKTADAGNAKLERQLDAAGREGATAIGKGLRDLKIPVGEVVVSNAYRAMETARLAQLGNPQFRDEIGDNGQSMQGISDAQTEWLKKCVATMPKGETNTIVVTHNPNLIAAFPDWGPSVAQGEAVILGFGEKGAPIVLGRIKPDEWPALK